MQITDLKLDSMVAALVDGCPPLPTPDLVACARQSGVLSIISCDLPAEGTMQAVAGGFRIYFRGSQYVEFDMNASEPVTLSPRARFTLAHEIAHTLFYERPNGVKSPLELPQLQQELRRGTAEVLCNDLAGRILIPTTVLRPRFTDRRSKCSVEDVLELSIATRTSLHAAIARLRQTPVGFGPYEGILCVKICADPNRWTVAERWSGVCPFIARDWRSRPVIEVVSIASESNLRELLEEGSAVASHGGVELKLNLVRDPRSRTAALLSVSEL